MSASPSTRKWLAGRTCIVTGGSRGLGEHIAGGLARAGANLVLTARSEGDLQRVAEGLRGLGAEVETVAGDIADAGVQAEVVARTEERFGRVDILVNNAGILNLAPFESLKAEEIAQVVEVNLLGTLQMTRRVLPGMLARGDGHVVNIASMAGTVGTPYDVVYSATKAGQIAATHALRLEYHGRGVRFSVICPGFVRESGMFHDRAEAKGVPAPAAIATTTPAKVVGAVLRAIRKDQPEVLVTRIPSRPLLTLGETSPRMRDAVLRVFGLTRGYRRMAEANRARQESAAAGGGKA